MSTEAGPDEGRPLSRYLRRFKAGEVIFEAGTPSTEAYLLQEGRARLIKRAGSRERSLRVVRPGDLFGEYALVSGTPRSSTAVALVDSAALGLDLETFEHVLTSNPTLGLRIVQQLVKRLRDADDQIELLMLRDSQVKIAAALLQLGHEAARSRPEDVESVVLSVSPMELSARVGLDVETVKRNVQTLRQSGHLVIESEQIQIHDLEGLRELRRLLEMKEEIAGVNEAGRTSRRQD
ncbi:MAG TPA: Crp/Fnr family transcriptional regulator [Polyangiaceae bacterium]|jgi:CRP-like cAMP-binding protein|nr:Crp/Fnr family transcriptional regulator [Polyangiaceae bacterium]